MLFFKICDDHCSRVVNTLPDAEEGCEDGSVDLSEVIVAVVDRLQLVELGKGVPRDLQQLVEGGVQELDPLLVLHWDLTKRELKKKFGFS